MQGRRMWWRKKCLHHGGRWQGSQFSAPKDKGKLMTFSKPDPPALSSNTAREFSFPDHSATSLKKSAKINTYFEATERKFSTQVSVDLIHILHKKVLAQPHHADLSCMQAGQAVPEYQGDSQGDLPSPSLLASCSLIRHKWVMVFFSDQWHLKCCAVTLHKPSPVFLLFTVMDETLPNSWLQIQEAGRSCCIQIFLKLLFLMA